MASQTGSMRVSMRLQGRKLPQKSFCFLVHSYYSVRFCMPIQEIFVMKDNFLWTTLFLFDLYHLILIYYTIFNVLLSFIFLLLS